ncbi:non-ribosomal peptide synthetase [Dyella subtropica]|uniref:non-ribosomal peptide synthetase n=1 Tax=Dyella subtropica TaxID=2992127 RepID=UPI00225B3E03|nr:non-ribosomal peptide synthetase [Dyella subtropica]
MPNSNVQTLFAEMAERYADQVAIEYEAVPADGRHPSATYGHLARQSNRLARCLARMGVGPGMPVAILAEDVATVVIAILGVLKAGAAFMPLDPHLPPARIDAMLELAQAPLILAESGTAPLLARLNLPLAARPAVLPLDAAADFSALAPDWRVSMEPWWDEAADPFAVEMAPDAFCYLFFTSGSTGQPKGIAGRLKAIDHFIRWEIESFGVGPGTRVSQLTTPSFDAFLRDIFTPLCAGGTVCVPDNRTQLLTPERLAAWIEARRIQLVHCVPTVFRLLSDGVSSPESLPDLRWVLLAGEPVTPADVNRWTQMFGERIRLANLYGPSETTMTKFCHLISAADGHRLTVPIGQPIPGARALVVDARNRPCPPGTIGEILIRTPYRTLGYYRRPDLTAEVFVPNPFANGDTEDVVYRTGDLGRVLQDGMLQDGTFELIGRKDNQVKIRGVRIELAEIEDRLRGMPEVVDAVVVARKDAAGALALFAYVVQRAELSAAELRTRLSESLTEVMIPAAFVTLSELPRTITGKVDRKALPAPEQARRLGRPPYEAPRTASEQILADIWSQLLGLEQIGVNDHFFDLGGHSILAMQMLARLKGAFEVDIPVAALFDSRNLAALAAWIDTARFDPNASSHARERLEVVARDRRWPLSFTQQRLWFLEQLTPGTTAYHTPAAVRIEGRLNADSLEAGLNLMLHRQEGLRTGFRMDDLQAYQLIQPAASLALQRIDLADRPADTVQAELAALIATECAKPFDLASPPLMRATLVRLSETEHVAVLVMHHLVSDAWSVGVLCRDLVAGYRAAETGGAAASLPPLAFHYLDFAAWQRRELQSVLPNLLDFWRTRLAGIEPLQIPTDRPRPAMPSFRGARQPFSLDAPTCVALNDLARRHKVTLYMVLLAAFKALLHRYTGQNDIAIGTPVANRPLTEMEDAVGFFANTLVLRSDLSADPSFAELLARVRQTALDAYAHQDLPFDEVVRLLQPERDLSRQPLFQVMFVLQNAPMAPLLLPGLVFSDYPLDPNAARFDLTVELHECEGGLAGHVDYATDLFDAQTIERLLRHYRVLLVAASADPLRRLSALPMLAPDERAALLPSPQPPLEDSGRLGGCLHELFAQRAAETPDAIALSFRSQRISYLELELRANRLANYLRSQGVGPEVRVALFFDRSPEVVVAILGVLKAGGVYVPMETAYPAERLGFMLDDTGARLVVTQHDLLGRLPAAHPPSVCLDADAVAIAAQPQTCPQSGVGPGHAAYVIYTSGSTGRPKGVPVEHRNVVRLFQATEQAFTPAPGDVWTLFHSYAFDFSVWEIWGALLHGGRLIVVPFWQTRSPEALLELLVTEEVTVLNQTPSAFWQLVRACETADAPCPPALRLVIFGGEALDFRRLRGWFRRYGDSKPRLVNMYGITETTVHVTCRPVTQADAETDPGSLIGAPLRDLCLYVLDPHGEPVPPGVIGEMYVGGAGVARGYLNRPALTAARFVPDPFSGAAGARLYRSGDLARRRADGEIEYLGRIDHQVKIRGFRIELAEIEAVMSEYPTLREAVVLLREDVPGEPRLVAYVTRRPDGIVLLDDLRRFLTERLPDYMIPAAVVTLEALPLTRNGKIDRAALPPPPAERPEMTTDFVAPRTEHERELAAIWCDVLGLEKVGTRDNFFVLGGDSIRSIQVCGRAQQCGLSISVQQLFRLQTIDGLLRELANGSDPAIATALDSAAFSLIGSADLARMPADVEDAFPLATLQLGMLYHSDLSDGGATYHDVFSYRLRAPFDAGFLRDALDAIARRHGMLRTSFDLSNFSEPLQLVHRRAPIPVSIEDLSTLSPAACDAAVARLVEAKQQHVRDWRRAPLLDVHIQRLDPARFQFTLSFHHAILDGWSVASFLTELFQEYFARIEGTALPALAAPTLSYRQFIALERQTLAQRTSRDFWRHRLFGCEFLKLPRAPFAEETSGGVVEREVAIPPEVSEGLKRAARSMGIPVKSVLLAAHACVLGLLGNATDIVTGLVAHTRLEEADGERLLGLFLNTLPLRLRLDAESWTDLATRAFEAEVELLPHRRYPLALIQRDHGGAALFEAVFNFTHYHVYRDLRDTADAEVLDGHIFEETNFPLTANFSLDARTGAVRLVLLCDRGLFADAEQLDRLSHYYAAALADLAGNPQGRYADTRLMAADERAQQLAAGRGDSTPPILEPIHEQVAKQARLHPDAIAVSDGTASLSYAELERRADHLAWHLRSRCPRGDLLVALCLPRSVDLVVGMLAVFKAGGAYLPLDPHHPAERLRYMLEDAGLPLLLTHGSLRGLEATTLVPADRVLWMDALEDEPAPNPEGLPSTAPDAAAYVIYTSGSTGRPKGVVVTHRALSNFVAAMTERLGLSASDRLLATTAVTFDIAALELLLPLALGAMVIVADRTTVQDPGLLAARIADAGTTVLQATPSLWRGLVDSGWQAYPHLTLLCGGEALDRALADHLIAAGARLFNMYGPTETTIWSSTHEIDAAQGPVPLGRPILNTELYVLDRHMQPVPLLVPGELHIGGTGVARGYLGRPALTAERFLPDPFSDRSGARLYKTGDLVRWLPGHQLEFLGRIDHQVKIRGHRVELGEIEAVLASHPSVGRCVVAMKQGAGEPTLVAYLTSPYDTRPAPSALRRWLLERLPEHMVPAELVLLNVFPMTPNGKIDRQMLPSLAAALTPAARADATQPRDRLELALAQLWEEVLEQQAIGVHDHYSHDLGGHSIQAVRLAARIRETLDPTFRLTTLLQGGTVARVAGHIRHRHVQARTPVVPLQPKGGRRPLFCVHPAVGNVLCYLSLAHHIGPRQPLFGLQAPEVDGLSPSAKTVEELAARHIAAIRGVQATGPYLLAGHSFGGLVAFEMSRQLHAAGERVDRLVLIDAILPDTAVAEAVPTTVPAPADDAEWLAATARTLERYFGRALGEMTAVLDGCPAAEGMERLLQRMAQLEVVPAEAGRSLLAAMLAAQKASEQLAAHYRPRSHDGPVTLIRARDLHAEDARRISPTLLMDNALGWGAFVTGPLDVQNISGDHLSMLTEPHVQELVDALLTALDVPGSSPLDSTVTTGTGAV